jgi:hypothetical protein
VIEGLGLDRPCLVVLGAAPWLEAFERQHAERVGPIVALGAVDAAADVRELAARVAAEVMARDC